MNEERIKKALEDSDIKGELLQNLTSFFESYIQAIKSSKNPSFDPESFFLKYIDYIHKELVRPTLFDHFHLLERWPDDYYAFGLEAVEPLIDKEASFIKGEENLKEIIQKTSKGENVILLANHQAEIDPQVISILLKPFSKELASSMIFVAGHRVTQDPIAIPFSRGRNLLCIHSKRYIEHPPEKKQEKLLHNAKTLSKLDELLNEGGVCIYVAPSGGRDRLDETGKAKIAPFDAQSVEMFSLLSQKTKIPTHLHLLALDTIHLLPPPSSINVTLGEERRVAFGPAHLYFGPKLDFESIGSSQDRKERRQERADILTREVERMWEEIT
jgi:glycerol-3-phosphate O-acyltransferase